MYLPYVSVIEETRNELQRNILALEDKLRLRKEIDFDICMNRNMEISRRAQALAYEPYYIPQTYSNLKEDYLIAEQLRFAKQEEEENRRHFFRLQELERQKLKIGDQNILYERREPYRTQEDEALIRKYEDGTRAREYQRSIDSYANSKYNSARKQTQGTATHFQRSPYSKIKFQSEKKNLTHKLLSSPKRNLGQNNEAPHFGNSAPRYQQQKSNEKPSRSLVYGDQKDQQSAKKKAKQNLSSKNRSISQKQFNNSSKKKNINDYSAYINLREQKTNRSSHSATKRSILQRSRKTQTNVQGSAMQKIKNRLKLSEIVYKDSKFKNVKHELAHLFNTYDCEYKLRKEIKQKINFHPTTLKKHAMVAE